jgi:hypothetical protein
MLLVGGGLLILAIASSAGVGAASPTVHGNVYTARGCTIGDNVCLNRGVAYPCANSYLCAYGHGYGYAPTYGYAYKDSRYCNDGDVIATPYGYRCANGTPLFVSGQYTTATVPTTKVTTSNTATTSSTTNVPSTQPPTTYSENK